MKVLMLTTSFPLYQGHPAGTFVYEQARHLCRAGVSVDILAPSHPGARAFETMDGMHVRRFSYFWPRRRARLCYGAGIPENMRQEPVLRFQMPFLVFFFMVHTFCLARRYDVIYAHWSLAGLAAVLAGMILKRPVVVMIHHGQERYGGNRLEKYVIDKADRVVCNSRYTAEAILRYFKPRDCSLIPPGVDVEMFKPQEIDPAGDFFKRLGIPAQGAVVLAMGRHIGWKGFDYLIEAAARLKRRSPFCLVIGGQGPETGNLKKKVAGLGLSESVVFVGGISNHEMPRLYNRATIFAQPSIVDAQGNTEGLGVVILEAMACGLACVASAVGGIPDIVRDGYNGILTPPSDAAALAEAIARLLNDPAMNRRMGENGRRFVVENYAWPRLTEQTVALLNSLPVRL